MNSQAAVEHTERRVQHSWCTFIPAVLFLLIPFLGAGVGLLYLGLPDILPLGDAAFIELAVRSATDCEQLLGSYSRFGFNHPGPLYFYVQVPLFVLLGEVTLPLHVTTICLNGLAAGGIVWALSRLVSGLTFLFGLLCVAVYCAFLGQFLVEFWAPAVVILPFVFAMVCAAVVIVGEDRLMVSALFAASLVAQTQLGYTPTLLAVAAFCGLTRAAMLRRWLALPKPRTPTGRRRMVIWVSVVAVLWLPTAIDQVYGSGNLSNIVSAFSADAGDVTDPDRADFTELCRVTTAFSAAPLGSGALPKSPATWQAWLFWVQVGVLIAGVVVGRKCRPALTALSTVGLVCVVMAIFSIHSIKGEFHHHITLWMSCIGLFVYLVAGLIVQVLVGRITGSRRLVFAGALFSLSGLVLYLNTVQILQAVSLIVIRSKDEPTARVVRALSIAASESLERHADRDIVIHVSPPNDWGMASCLALALARKGLRPRVSGPSEFRFPGGFQLHESDTSGVELWLIQDGTTPGLDHRLVANVAGTRIYLKE